MSNKYFEVRDRDGELVLRTHLEDKAYDLVHCSDPVRGPYKAMNFVDQTRNDGITPSEMEFDHFLNNRTLDEIFS
ncbi:MAG: hypothetical protein AABW73_00130 [Nanoarchaeota archaeon]